MGDQFVQLKNERSRGVANFTYFWNKMDEFVYQQLVNDKELQHFNTQLSFFQIIFTFTF